MHGGNVLKHTRAEAVAAEQLARTVVKNNAEWFTRLIAASAPELGAQTSSSQSEQARWK